MMSLPANFSVEDFRVTLVGAGALGSALATALHAKGYQFVSVINRTTADAQQLALSLGAPHYSDRLLDVPYETNLLLLAVNDGAIEDVAEKISELRLGFKTLIAIHFSGALSTDALKSLAAKGSITIAMHPFQTFTRQAHARPERPDLFKCYFGLQAPEIEGIEIGKKIAHDLGSKVMIVPKDAKTLYHIAGVMTSNYLVTLTSLAAEVFAGLGLQPKEAFKVFEPIMLATLDNMRHADDARESLSGPIERGDARTIQKHLNELSEQLPHMVPVYVALAIETVRVAIHKGSISQSEAADILDLLEDFARRETNA